MPTLDVSSETILDPDDSSFALLPESHDDLRNPLEQPKHRDHEEDQEEQQQWLEQWIESLKNFVAIVEKWIEKDKALWVASELGLDHELKSISLSKIRPCLDDDEDLD